MKKLVYLIFCVSLLLLGSYNVVYAQSGDLFPKNFISLEYYDYEFVQEHSMSVEYNVIYRLPLRLSEQVIESIGHYDYVLVHDLTVVLTRGQYIIDTYRGYYKLEEIIVVEEETYFYFVFVLNKDAVLNRYYSAGIEPFFEQDSKMYIRYDYSLYEILRDYFYRIPPDKRPENLYQVGMSYSTGSAYAGRMYWTLQDYIDISDYIEDYNLFLSYTTVEGANLQNLYFYDVNKNLVAYVQRPHFDEFIYKFENENRYVVGMLHFKDTNTGNYVNWDNVKYMRVTYHTEPYPDSSVLINLTNSLDISIGEYWRTAEAFSNYYQAGYNEGFENGVERGQNLRSEEILEMLEREYQRGYNAGLNDNFNVFSYLEALFGEQGLGRLLRLELLPGVSLGAVIMIPLAFWLVSFIMRWFR